MKGRKFNNVMPKVNETWAAEVLGMELKSNGPDLINNSCVVEVKFSLSNGKYPLTWTVLEYQMEYPDKNPERNAYWGLGIYTLSQPVSNIKTKDNIQLEKLVESREFWLVSWNWMNQFLPSKTSGRTEKSEWESTLRYPKHRLLPKIIKTYKVNKGLIHLTKNVNPKDFMFLETGKIEECIPF